MDSKVKAILFYLLCYVLVLTQNQEIPVPTTTELAEAISQLGQQIGDLETGMNSRLSALESQLSGRILDIESQLAETNAKFGQVSQTIDENTQLVTTISNTLVKYDNYNQLWKKNFKFLNTTINAIKRRLQPKLFAG